VTLRVKPADGGGRPSLGGGVQWGAAVGVAGLRVYSLESRVQGSGFSV
jgi:hypothetical protein